MVNISDKIHAPLTGIFWEVRTKFSIFNNFFLEFLQTLHTSSLDLGTYKIFCGTLKFACMPEYEAQT